MERLPAREGKRKKTARKTDAGAGKGPKGESDNLSRLREAISGLEKVLERILDFYDGYPGMEAGSLKMWAGDAKEAFYSVAACWEMLNSAAGEKRSPRREGQGVPRAAGGPRSGLGRWSDPNVAEGLRKMVGETKDFPSAARHFATYSKSCTAQAASELSALRDEIATVLEVQWNKAYGVCAAIIAEELRKYPEPCSPPSKRVIKVSDTEYHLPCSVCGKISARFIVKSDKILTSGRPGLIYEGITCGKDIGMDNAKQVFENLDRDDIAAVHRMALKNTFLEEGIDAYCPECDRIYCHEHYNVTDIFDDGFYDYAEGTCPKGHRRMIDD